MSHLELALIIAGYAAGGWLLIRLPPLPRSELPTLPTTGASVSVIIPARDEAVTLPVLLTSLRALHPTPCEVLLVDDGSSDDTAAIAARGGATVLTAPEPPAGWTGKTWACHLGAQASTGSHLLFLDADTQLAPDALARLMADLLPKGGLLSVQPFHLVRRSYEQLSAYFNLVSMMASGAFTLGTPRAPLAFGPCLLTSRRDYDRAGGHAAVRGYVLDDAQLAIAYQRSGLAVRCRGGGTTISMRMYPSGFGQLAEGWTKNVASGALQARPGPALGAALWVFVNVMVAFNSTAGLLDWRVGGGAPPVAWLVASLAIVAQLGWMLSRIGSFRWWAWVVFPVPLAVFLVLFVNSAFATFCRHEVRWRGRSIDTKRDRGDQ